MSESSRSQTTTTTTTAITTTIAPFLVFITSIVSHVTPFKYLLFLTFSLMLYLCYLILPRGVRAEYCCASRRRYRRQRRRRRTQLDQYNQLYQFHNQGLHSRNYGVYTTPKDVLERILAHSHSYRRIVATDATADSPTNDFSNFFTPSPNHAKSSEMPISRVSAISTTSPASFTGLGKQQILSPEVVDVSGSVWSGVDEVTPRLGMARPPSTWKETRSISRNDTVSNTTDVFGNQLMSPNLKYCPHSSGSNIVSNVVNNNNGVHQSFQSNDDHQSHHHSSPSYSSILVERIRQLLSQPPGIRLIAHGTKCHPRPVWITLHFDSLPPPTSFSPQSQTPSEYKNCLTWRAELRPSSSSLSPNSWNPSSTHSHMTRFASTTPSPARLGNLRKVSLNDILGVQLGKRTTALRRVQTAKSVPESECFSLLTRTGTLDLQCMEWTGGAQVGQRPGEGLATAIEMREAIIACLAMVMSSKGLDLDGVTGGFEKEHGYPLSSSPVGIATPGLIRMSHSETNPRSGMKVGIGIVGNEIDRRSLTTGRTIGMMVSNASSAPFPLPSALPMSKNDATFPAVTNNTSSSNGSSKWDEKTMPSEVGGTTCTGNTSSSKTISTVSF